MRVGKDRPHDEIVAELTARVEALTARLEAIEAGQPHANGNHPVGRAQSRRDVLKLAGAAAAGAAGSLLLNAAPAAATNAQPVLLGNSTTNDAASTTDVFPTSLSAPAPLFQATGQGVSPTTTVAPTASTTAPLAQSIPLIGAIGPGGTLPSFGGAPVYPGYAPIQGVGGSATVGGAAVSEGLNGWGSGDGSIGVTGESDTGYGVSGSSGGIDIAAMGAGRLLQLGLPQNSSFLTNGGPAGPPDYPPNDFEQVRDGLGVLWLSGPGGAWRRLNSTRVDSADGTTAFAPARLIDTRNSTGTGGSGLGANQPLQHGVTYIFGPFTGTHGLPPDAIGIIGNLTAVNYTNLGYVTVFPGGLPWPGTSSLNFAPPFQSTGWANAFTVGFGTGANAGKISIRLSDNGITSHIVLDVTGYLQ